MKFEQPKNSNYAATVVRLPALVPLAGCDNVVGANLFGYQAIVGKDSKEGDIGIFFPAETQLSEEYCKQNNLFRHKELNADQTKAGYIEDNRRVKAVKFRGHTSSCLFMPLISLKGFVEEGQMVPDVGDTFDQLNGMEICRKYEVLMVNGRMKGPANTPPQKKRYDTLFIPEHIDTENWWKNEHKVNRDAELIITAKIHGTSIRIGNSLVERKLTLRDRIAKFFGAKVSEKEYAMLYGSKKVIKDVNNPNQIHYYAEDIWTEEGKKLDGLVPEGYVVYAELVGWTPSGKPIQEGYTYGFEKGTCGLYVYRVAHINERGLMVDLSWDQVKQFCTERGLKHVVELARVEKDKFVPEEYLDKQFVVCGYKDCLPLSGINTVDEGVCVRVEGLIPQLYKAKSPKFFEHETSLLDKEVVDMETSGESA